MSTGLDMTEVPAGPARQRVPAAREPRRWPRMIALVVVAALAGAAGGVVADRIDDDVTGTVSVAPGLTLSGPAMDVATLVAAVGPAVVRVEARHAGGTKIGTGIVLTSDGKVLTCAHVVARAVGIGIFLGGGAEELRARRIATDRLTDVALLQIVDVSGLPVAALGSSSQVRVGDDVVAIGHALDIAGEPTVSRGIVSGTERVRNVAGVGLTGLLQTDAAISSGNSGGPLLNAAGQVVGMITAVATGDRTTTVENLNFAVPADTVTKTLRDLGITVTAP